MLYLEGAVLALAGLFCDHNISDRFGPPEFAGGAG